VNAGFLIIFDSEVSETGAAGRGPTAESVAPGERAIRRLAITVWASCDADSLTA
jgi:hypothetical protein